MMMKVDGLEKKRTHLLLIRLAVDYRLATMHQVQLVVTYCEKLLHGEAPSLEALTVTMAWPVLSARSLIAFPLSAMQTRVSVCEQPLQAAPLGLPAAIAAA